MKRFKNTVCLICCTTLLTSLSSCMKEVEEYYNPKSTLDKNIIQVLEEDGRFADFVGIIDKLGLRETLGGGAIYTCFAPLDSHVKAYFENKGYASIDQAPEVMLRRYVNYHFINGMYYLYDLDRRYLTATTDLQRSNAVNYKTRIESMLQGKSIRIYPPSFFQRQRADYESLYGTGTEYSDFMVEGAEVSETDRDIDASNGVIHVLETRLDVLPRTDEALANDPETTIFSSWLERHASFVLGERDEFGWVDTTLYKTFAAIGRNFANEDQLTTLLVPTNEAILNYFEPYMEDLHHTIDSVPQRVMYSLIRAYMIGNNWFKSDIVRLDPEWSSQSARPHRVHDVGAAISGAVLASNGLLYKVDELIESPEMHSVQGGIFVKQKTYSQWYWMFENTDLVAAAGLTDRLYYQHPPVTVLVQPDVVWGLPLAQDLNPEARELRSQQCRAGIFNLDVRADGGFRKRFYPTGLGYVLYDGGRFYDYTGHSVKLLTEEPVWERTSGAIFEIDGFLTPLDKLDETLTVYSLVQNDPDLSLFAGAIVQAGMETELRLAGFFSYTILAPDNTAIVNSGVNLGELSPQELRTFVGNYIIPNRYVFTDGTFNGQIADKNGTLVTVNGAWDTFSVSRPGGGTLSPVVSNIQGTNGVVHKVNQVF